jgi:hypothetical protein
MIGHHFITMSLSEFRDQLAMDRFFGGPTTCATGANYKQGRKNLCNDWDSGQTCR